MRCLLGTFLQREGHPLPALGVRESQPRTSSCARAGHKGAFIPGGRPVFNWQLAMKELPDPGFPMPLTPAGRRPLTLCCPCALEAGVREPISQERGRPGAPCPPAAPSVTASPGARVELPWTRGLWVPHTGEPVPLTDGLAQGGADCVPFHFSPEADLSFFFPP